MSDDAGELFEIASTLIATRHHVSPKRLVAPGPDEAQLDALLRLAAAAPDHGRLTPWRFVVVPVEQRHRLGQAFADALRERDPQAADYELEEARQKAHRAPLLLLAVARLGPDDPDVPAAERFVSLGCAIQNLLLGAHAMGFGTGLTSGRAMGSGPLRALFALEPDEQAVCCINVGTGTRSADRGRQRPEPARFTRRL